MEATINLNSFVKKSHIKAVERFAADLAAFAKETDEPAPTLYEDPWSWFTLANPRVEDGKLKYELEGREEEEVMVYLESDRYADGEDIYVEEDGIDSIMEYVKWWRSCLRRAKKYWAMDTDKLDALQEGYYDEDEV